MLLSASSIASMIDLRSFSPIFPFLFSPCFYLPYFSKDLAAGHLYEVSLPAGFVQDAAGNDFGALSGLPLQIRVDPDTQPPTLLQMIPSNGSVSIPSWTVIALSMDEVVKPGQGSLQLFCFSGVNVSIDVATAQIVGKVAMFKIPDTVQLTPGQTYGVRVPTGLFQDRAGNMVHEVVAGFFTVLSGSWTPNNYMGLAVQDSPPGATSDWNATTAGIALNGTSDAKLLASFPQNGSTDVPAQAGVAIIWWFSRSVTLSGKGKIDLLNSTGDLQIRVDTSKLKGNQTGYFAMPAYNSFRMPIPMNWTGTPLIRSGVSYTVAVAAGVFVDNLGKPLGKLSVSFTCLAEELDLQPPIILATSIDPESSDVSGLTTKVDFYFSEDITAHRSVITLSSPGGHSLTIPVSKTSGADGFGNILVSGNCMSVYWPSGFLANGGTFKVARW